MKKLGLVKRICATDGKKKKITIGFAGAEENYVPWQKCGILQLTNVYLLYWCISFIHKLKCSYDNCLSLSS